MRNNKVVHLLEGKQENISVSELEVLYNEYWKLLHINKFHLPSEQDAISMIRYLKRKSEDNQFKIGPYQNITVFEAANRIATDLVILKGIKQLIEEGREGQGSVINLCLGIIHVKNKGDFTINGKEGEAFNVAPSFFKGKLGSTIRKWKDKGLAYILVNDEVVKGEIVKEVKEKSSIALIGVKDWDRQ